MHWSDDVDPIVSKEPLIYIEGLVNPVKLILFEPFISTCHHARPHIRNDSKCQIY